MRVVMTSWGSRGDVEPLAALALRLKELGAEPRVCVPPDDDFVALLDRVGVPLIPLGPSVRSVVSGEKPASAKDAFWLGPALVDARYEVLAKEADGADVMLATGLFPAGARSVAKKFGLRYTVASMHVYGLPSHHFKPGARPGKPSSADPNDLEALWREDAERVQALYGDAENKQRAEIGLPPVDNLRDYVQGSQGFLAADPVLCPWADLVDKKLTQTGAWILPDERPLPDDLEAFLESGAPPVFVGFGSMGMQTTPDLGRVVVESVRAQGRRLLLGRGWAYQAQIEEADDCFVIGEVNQQALFPRVAAVVHHGGAGTTTTSTVAGVPQVIVPQIADQPMMAGRVAELGIGAAHDGAIPTVESLSAALKTALAPEIRARAVEVAGTMRTDGALVAAKLLIEG
ncbi:glycosyltransferase [Kutzneria sp. CA-103260]|uniref:glycosyltransferase n=1 Tax=Kutzneria sp. CA-103260 TaxID=2802641 RepID=UPI001BA86FB0|nr:glycosyltransferase [Kutzneria sp. CA-103260]QUQ68351.1 glycosyl transferase family protein [Kutzneria sp. CA-103260]